MKKKKFTRQRSDWIYATVNSKGVITFEYDPKSDAFSIVEAEPNSTRLVRSYERASGKEKVLLDIPSRNGAPSFSHTATLAREFDNLIAIDTGTRQIKGEWVSATVVYAVPKELRTYSDGIPFDLLRAYVAVGHAKDEKNERRGWHAALSRAIQPEYFLRNNKRIGIVVDSDLGEIPAINKREVKIYGDYMLPRFATLIYASDASSDSLPSQMIRFCDTAATKILDDVEKRPALPENARGIVVEVHSPIQPPFGSRCPSK